MDAKYKGFTVIQFMTFLCDTHRSNFAADFSQDHILQKSQNKRLIKIWEFTVHTI